MSKAATADSYSKDLLHQRILRTIICILFCIIALLPFVLLVMIGGHMVVEVIRGEEEEDEVCLCAAEVSEERLDMKELLLLAIATSIDALAVGVTFAFLQVEIVPAIVIIGSVTFVISAAGVFIGNIFGSKYKSRAELAGGIILILLGIKILLEHLGIV